MSVLSDYDLQRFGEGQDFEVWPLDGRSIQPASIDLRLGTILLRYRTRATGWVVVTDPYEPPDMVRVEMDEGGYTLDPGQFILGRTHENIRLGRGVAAQVDGKSSIGRLGLFVHTTAGWVDPGFAGVLTLELYNASPRPIMLTPLLPIAQLVIHRLTSTSIAPYAGKYQGAAGVEASKGVRRADGPLG